MYYTLSILPLSPPKTRITTISLLIGFSMILQFAGGVVFIAQMQYDFGKQILGILANIVLVLFYGSPLSVCVKVIRERDSSSLSLPLALASALNGGLWTIYGFAMKDYYVGVPNLPGILFALVQIGLMAKYPRKRNTAKDISGHGSSGSMVKNSAELLENA
ncbi:hypothetical protein HK100_009335 [Physocladia obscura]|uniref:Sugar transporter SWEET1 n=1 Tax=Physocladia obscura TaxID=109957 RepID=A0AAD5T3B4_9FUNG|nr:hypothetical protein HK100_009335 [Physocladia obscura]